MVPAPGLESPPLPEATTMPAATVDDGAAAAAAASAGPIEELYLYAFAPQAEVLRYLRTQLPPEERHRIPAIMEEWQRLQIRVVDLTEREAGLPDAIRFELVPPEHRAWLDALTEKTLFRKTFQNLPVSFALVEVDALVAPQRTVNATYARTLRERFPQSPTVAELLEICLSPNRPMEPIRYLEARSNTHIFSSPDQDVRFLGSYRKELGPDEFQYAESGGVPREAIIVFVGYGYAPINVFRVGGRMVLNNGFHRVYALRSLGVRWLPAVVQHVHNVDLEFPPAIAGLPREYLLNPPRPVLIKDFFEPHFTLSSMLPKRLKLVKVAVSASQYEVPV